MLNFFKKRKSREKPERKSNPEKKYAPNTKIQYQPDLVKTLKEEHVMLLEGFSRIVDAHASSEFDTLKRELLSFKALLRVHLLKENTSLYVYLKHATGDDESLSKLVSDMQLEMGKIGNTVFRFISKWSDPTISDFPKDFEDGLSAIGDTLVKRIQAEEKDLYPIY